MTSPKIGEVTLPGDIISIFGFDDTNDSSKIILGPGLKREPDGIFATKSGILKLTTPNIYWIDGHQKRYIPVKNDDVIGIVTGKHGDHFKLDIGSSEQASLSALAFEGATKRNRPQVQIGDLVFGKLLVADKDTEPELVCVDSYGKSKGLGVMTDGFVFTVSLELVRKLRTPAFKKMLNDYVGNMLPYEVAIGMNGRIWVKAKTIKNTIGICNVMLLAEHSRPNDFPKMCEAVMNAMAGF